MPRTVLDRELQNVHTQIIQLGTLVDKALTDALTSLERSDFTTFRRVIEADLTIDNLRTSIEEHLIRLLILQQPLAGRDLRYLTATLAIVGSLERIGDGAAGIAEISLRMPRLESSPSESTTLDECAPETPDESAGWEAVQEMERLITGHLLDLGMQARHILQETMSAFAHYDSETARHLIEEDELVDRRYDMVREELMHILATAHTIPALLHSASCFLQRVAYLLWIAHKLERVADHATKVCKKIIYIVEGRKADIPLP